MAKFTERDNVLEVSFDLALNKQAREEIDVYDIVLKHESGSEENTLVEFELSLKESGATLAVKIPKYYFSRLGVYSVAVKLSQRDAEALSGRSRIEASQPLCTVISLHRDMESGKTDVELVPFGTTASCGDAEGASTATADINSLLNAEIDVEALGFAEGDANRWIFRSGDDGGHAYTLGTVLKNIPNTSAGRAIAMANTASREAKQALASCRSIDTRVVGIEGTLTQLQQTNCSGCASLQESIERLSRRLIAVEERLNGSNAYVVPVSPSATPTEVATPTVAVSEAVAVAGATVVDSFTRVGAERESEGDEAATPVPDNHS